MIAYFKEINMSKYSNEFQEKVQGHLIGFKENIQYLPSKSEKKRFLYSDFSDNLYPALKHGILQYIYENGIPLHEYVNHVRSSQAFAFNLLFYPLKQQTGLLKCLSKKINKELVLITDFQFEYSPEKNILGEWKSDENRPEEYVTSVDVFISTVTADGEPINFFFEVKFTENEFGTCGGYDSKGNTGALRTGCEHSEKLLDDYKLCYLNGAKLQRKYFDEEFNIKKSFKPDMFITKCPFERFHQCLRNQSLSLKMEHKTYFCLVYHDGNENILHEWELYKDLCKDPSFLLSIKASEIVISTDDKQFKKYFADRYLIT
jgi:hypothetical protein